MIPLFSQGGVLNMSKAPSLAPVTAFPSTAPIATTRTPTSRPSFRPTVKMPFPPTTKPTTTPVVPEGDDSDNNKAVKIGVSVAVAVVAEGAICALLYWYYKRWKLHHRSVQDNAADGKSCQDDNHEEPPSSREGPERNNDGDQEEEFVF